MRKSNIVKMVIRGHEENDLKACLRNDLVMDEEPLEIVEYAYGKEGGDYDEHHPHMHVVIRTNKAIIDDTNILRAIWALDEHTNIQDIRLGDNFTAAAKYACKSGDYEWPSQYIPYPWSVSEPVWNPAQRAILDELEKQDHRQILVVVDGCGNSGKTYLAKWHTLRFKADRLQLSNNYKDLMRFAYDLKEKQNRPLETVYIDIPRAFPKSHLNGLYSAIETLKDGDAYDDRYSFADTCLSPPKICVMTNDEPNYDYLTKDRWVILHVRIDGSVVRSVAPGVEYMQSIADARKKRHREAQQRYMAKKRAGLFDTT